MSPQGGLIINRVNSMGWRGFGITNIYRLAKGTRTIGFSKKQHEERRLI